MCNCGVCERIKLTKEGKNPFFVRELYSDEYKPDEKELESLKALLNMELEKLIQ